MTYQVKSPMISKSLLLVIALAGGAGCGGKTGTARSTTRSPRRRTTRRASRSSTTRTGSRRRSTSAFIKSRFPYSKYAVLAELRLADAEFGAEQYLEAIDSYRLFIKFHPTHEMVANGYASFQIGEAYYKQLPRRLLVVPAVVREGSIVDRRRGERAQELPRQVSGLAVSRQGQGDPRQGRQAPRRSRVVRRALLLGPRQADGHRAPAAPPARALSRRRLRRRSAVAARPRVRRRRHARPREPARGQSSSTKYSAERDRAGPTRARRGADRGLASRHRASSVQRRRCDDGPESSS